MSEQKWTKGPWEIRIWEGDRWPERRVSLVKVNGDPIAISARYSALVQSQIDLSRAAECVNALDGIRNPVAVRNLIEVLEVILEDNGTVDQWWVDKAREALAALEEE